MEKIPDSLRLQDARLIRYLNEIMDSMSDFWETTIFHHYTDHGIRHSYRLVNILGSLLEDHHELLNEQERFILLASVHLHDIGMQSPQHAGLPLKNYMDYSWDEIEKVREKHHIAAHDMILESVSGKLELDLGLGNCQEYVRFIATVSMYHRELDLEGVEDTNFGGDPIRLRLLSSLLRLGDALDLDYRRVEIEVLKLWDIPLESKFHWWTHHYISSVSIERGKIGVYLRFPEEYRGHDARARAQGDRVQTGRSKPTMQHGPRLP